jgi:hypothetical protein
MAYQRAPQSPQTPSSLPSYRPDFRQRQSINSPSEISYVGSPGFTTEYKAPEVHGAYVPDSAGYEYARVTRLTNHRRSWKDKVCFVLSFVLGIGWLGPIAFLLSANVTNRIIGAAAWCPVEEQCNSISYQYNSNVTSATLSAEYDVDNHTLMGALQFVAKALEVWYIYIATVSGCRPEMYRISVPSTG